MNVQGLVVALAIGFELGLINSGPSPLYDVAIWIDDVSSFLFLVNEGKRAFDDPEVQRITMESRRRHEIGNLPPPPIRIRPFGNWRAAHSNFHQMFVRMEARNGDFSGAIDFRKIEDRWRMNTDGRWRFKDRSETIIRNLDVLVPLGQ